MGRRIGPRRGWGWLGRSAPGKARGRARGQSLVELALALPVLLLLLLGTIDLGQMFFDYIQLRNGVREGASYGARFPEDTARIRERVYRHDGDAEDDGIAVDVRLQGDYDTVGGDATITVSGSRQFQPITASFLARFGIGPFTMTSSASAKVLT